jgi:hypothetical protein
MKNTLIIFVVIVALCYSCEKKEENQSTFNLEDYIDIEFVQIEHNGQKLDLFDAKLSKKRDSIGTKIYKNPRRYEFLIANRIDNDSVLSVISDTTKAKSVFYSLVNTKEFRNYFYTTYFAKNEDKVIFTEEELMKIASMYFLSEKQGDRYRTRVCLVINGLDNIDLKNQDYTLLEAIVFEAIFERLANENMKEPDFISNLDEYSSEAIAAVNDSIANPLLFVRESVFSAMENDQDLKTYLLNYLEQNKENIAIEIVK